MLLLKFASAHSVELRREGWGASQSDFLSGSRISEEGSQGILILCMPKKLWLLQIVQCSATGTGAPCKCNIITFDKY